MFQKNNRSRFLVAFFVRLRSTYAKNSRYYDRLQPLLEGMKILFKKTETDNEDGARDEKRIGGR